MKIPNQDIRSMEFLAGRLGLDFVNTAEYRKPNGEVVNDFFKTSDDVATFLHRTEAIQDSLLRTFSCATPALLKTARELREFLYTGFRKFMTNKGSVAPAFIEQCNNWLEKLHDARGLSRSKTGSMSWIIQMDTRHPSSLLLPVMHSALEIFTKDDSTRLRHCPAEDCGWLFYDTSKAGKRVWCDMSDCGNREKARRFYLAHEER